MSIVPKEMIEVISQSCGINNLSVDAALALAPDVEYRMCEIMQEAIKCMHHSRRTVLTTDDVNSALTLRNVEPVYGFASGDSLRFKRAVGHMDLFYVDDKELDLKDVIEAPLPKAPLDTSLVCHWLAIEGVQPAIPENAHAEVIVAPTDCKMPEKKENESPVDVRLPVKHILSRELQLYFDKVTELAVTKPESVLFKEALVSLATDSGLHPLVPYFTCFIADEVSHGLNNFHLLFALMRLVGSLLQNPHIHTEPYLHQLMPSVVTCLVAKRLGNRVSDSHWELRDFTANLVASICKRFGHVYSNLQTRLTKTLVHAFLDPKRSLTQHYGAIQGLAALGPNVVRLLLLPNLNVYMKLLEPEMLIENQKNEMKRYEAWRVYGALLHAAGRCIFDLLKVFPQLPSPPLNTIMKTNGKVNTTPLNKRKANAEHTEDQPPLKKVEIDGPSTAPQNNSVSSNCHEEPAGLLGDSNVGPSSSLQNNSVSSNCHGEPAGLSGDSDVGPSSSRQNNSVSSNCHRDPAGLSGKSNVGPSSSRQSIGQDKTGERMGGRQGLKMRAIIDRVWKDDLDSGHLLVSLYEMFGERILNYVPNPEMSVFL